MFNYKDTIHDKEIINIYNEIEKKTNYVLSHGLKHINNVITHCKNIAKEISLNSEETKLLLIAASLHDVGRNFAEQDHHIAGLQFIKNYLKGKLNPEEIDIVCSAIFYHDTKSCNFEKMDNIAFCLILADKLDYEKSRLIPELIDNNPKLNFYLNIKKIDVKCTNLKLEIRFFVKNKNFENEIYLFIDKMKDILDNFTSHFNLSGWELKML